jgi:hypothetical protein
VRINARQAVGYLLIAGAAGGLLFLPAVTFVGNMLAPTQPALATTHVPPIIGEALWARANGGRATELQPINPFTLGRMMSCHLLAEVVRDGGEEDAQHEECMKLIPAVQAVGYVSNLHLQSQGVWQDPRVPFVSFATMTNVSNKWSRAQLLDALAERGEFIFGFKGVEQASRGFFNKPAAEVNVAEAAVLGALLNQGHLDPWCGPGQTAELRRKILEKMRDNGAIDEATLQSANAAPLGLGDPPPNRKPCQ